MLVPFAYVVVVAMLFSASLALPQPSCIPHASLTEPPRDPDPIPVFSQVTLCDRKRTNLLHAACEMGHGELASALIDRYEISVEDKDRKGQERGWRVGRFQLSQPPHKLTPARSLVWESVVAGCWGQQR